jgi:opacity protein-like surface antigen
MKKTILWTATVLALLAGPASAADFGVFGSYWDTEDADQALGVGGKISFARIFELRASYFSDVTTDTEPERNDFEVKVLPLEAGLAFKFAQGERFTPYIGGGAGYYLLDTNRFAIDDEVGYYAVLGADIKGASGLGFMVEGIYRNMEATVRGELDDDPDIDDEVDLQLGGFGVNAGLVWSF